MSFKEEVDARIEEISRAYDNYKGISGKLYDYKTAINSCPEGWHLPTDAEWTTLTDFLGGEKIAGEKLKSYFGWVIYNTLP